EPDEIDDDLAELFLLRADRGLRGAPRSPQVEADRDDHRERADDDRGRLVERLLLLLELELESVDPVAQPVDRRGRIDPLAHRAPSPRAMPWRAAGSKSVTA